ncbi:MAG: adenylate/guanylate cyclase domain-containing protein [Bacteroidia bacterium]
MNNVPSVESYPKLTFGNTGASGDFCFIFIDIRESSRLVSNYGEEKAAKIYESFHEICVRIIQTMGGSVRSFDGDRVMGVFAGSNKENDAVETAFYIGFAIEKDLNTKFSPMIKPIRYGIGIETGETLVVKVGKGRDINTQDLIWLGEACNYASYYSDKANNQIIISQKVYNKLVQKNIKSQQYYYPTEFWADIKLPLKKGVNSVAVKVSTNTRDYSHL